MYALIEGVTIYDVCTTPFEVTPNFSWVECPDYVKPYTWEYIDGQFVEIVPPAPPEQPVVDGVQTL